MQALTAYTYQSSPVIKFNDLTDPKNWYQILSIMLDTEVRNVEDPKMNEGIEDFSSILGKGILKIKAAVIAESPAKLNELIYNLKEAFNPRLTQENSSSDEGYLPFQWTDVVGADTFNLQVYAKPVEIPKFVRNEKGSGTIVEITCKIKEPKKVSQSTKTVTLTNAAATGTNDNDGDMPAYPVITITGPTAANPKVLYSQTGEYIQLDTTIASGHVVTIDCKKATITDNGTNIYSYKNAGSTFFDLKSGAVTLIGSNLSTGNIAVVYRDSWTL